MSAPRSLPSVPHVSVRTAGAQAIGAGLELGHEGRDGWELIVGRIAGCRAARKHVVHHRDAGEKYAWMVGETVPAASVAKDPVVVVQREVVGESKTRDDVEAAVGVLTVDEHQTLPA